MLTSTNKLQKLKIFERLVLSSRKDKKGQMEIMGLAIIVILLSLAMIFVIQFIVLKEPSNVKEEFTSKQLAVNTVNTLLATNTDCNEFSISKLLIDCAEGTPKDCPDNKNSCTYAEELIDQILTETLNNWNKQYYLTVTSNEQIISSLDFGNPCTGVKTSSSPCCILPTRSYPMTINLDICG